MPSTISSCSASLFPSAPLHIAARMAAHNTDTAVMTTYMSFCTKSHMRRAINHVDDVLKTTTGALTGVLFESTDVTRPPVVRVFRNSPARLPLPQCLSAPNASSEPGTAPVPMPEQFQTVRKVLLRHRPTAPFQLKLSGMLSRLRVRDGHIVHSDDATSIRAGSARDTPIQRPVDERLGQPHRGDHDASLDWPPPNVHTSRPPLCFPFLPSIGLPYTVTGVPAASEPMYPPVETVQFPSLDTWTELCRDIQDALWEPGSTGAEEKSMVDKVDEGRAVTDVGQDGLGVARASLDEQVSTDNDQAWMCGRRAAEGITRTAPRAMEQGGKMRRFIPPRIARGHRTFL